MAITVEAGPNTPVALDVHTGRRAVKAAMWWTKPGWSRLWWARYQHDTPSPLKFSASLEQVRRSLEEANSDHHQALARVESDLRRCDEAINRLLKSIEEGVSAKTISARINSLSIDREQLEQKRVESVSAKPIQTLDITKLRFFLANFRSTFDSATTEQRRVLLRTFIRHLEMDPEKNEVRVEFYPDHVMQSGGAGSGDWAEMHVIM